MLPQTDFFSTSGIARLATELDPTKRKIVSLVGRFYDPFGYLSPITIRLKVLIQDLCELKIDWDQPLDGAILSKWQALVSDLQEAQPISIPRSYFNGVNGEVRLYQLYGFCDASIRAYAAVVYLVIETDVGNYVKFVVSKTHVAPIQSQTIPRLELLSALLPDGNTFKSAARIIETIMAHRDIKQHLSGVGVEWNFNLEKAPWWGGIFERMVISTKHCLRKMIGQAKFTHDELLTAVIEVEAIINSRPLSYVSADDLEEQLTPSHLVTGRRILSLPENLCYREEIYDEDFEITPIHLNKREKHLNNVLNHFWKRWKHEYLLGTTKCSTVTDKDVQ